MTNNDIAEDNPTWSAFNSIISDEKLTTTLCILPIIHDNPTDWSNWYSAVVAASKLEST